jgi:hypothetical protein
MSRANTGRFAGIFEMGCERELLLAMQKVEGSNPFSRFLLRTLQIADR